jgi:hypothetical protein
MSSPSTLDNSTLECDSSAVVVYTGENVTAGAYAIKLVDLTVPYGLIGSQAIIQVYDSDGFLVKEDTVSAYASKQITLPNADSVTVHVCSTNFAISRPGWVKMSVTID